MNIRDILEDLFFDLFAELEDIYAKFGLSISIEENDENCIYVSIMRILDDYEEVIDDTLYFGLDTDFSEMENDIRNIIKEELGKGLN